MFKLDNAFKTFSCETSFGNVVLTVKLNTKTNKYEFVCILVNSVCLDLENSDEDMELGVNLIKEVGGLEVGEFDLCFAFANLIN